MATSSTSILLNFHKLDEIWIFSMDYWLFDWIASFNEHICCIHISDISKLMATSRPTLSIRRKLALIIGNGEYSQKHNRLDYSIKNAKDLSALLKSIDFHVTLVCNSNKQEMVDGIVDFAHGIQKHFLSNLRVLISNPLLFFATMSLLRYT